MYVRISETTRATAVVTQLKISGEHNHKDNILHKSQQEKVTGLNPATRVATTLTCHLLDLCILPFTAATLLKDVIIIFVFIQLWHQSVFQHVYVSLEILKPFFDTVENRDAAFWNSNRNNCCTVMMDEAFE